METIKDENVKDLLDKYKEKFGGLVNISYSYWKKRKIHGV